MYSVENFLFLQALNEQNGRFLTHLEKTNSNLFAELNEKNKNINAMINKLHEACTFINIINTKLPLYCIHQYACTSISTLIFDYSFNLF